MPGVANGAERVGTGSHQFAAGTMASHATPQPVGPKGGLPTLPHRSCWPCRTSRWSATRPTTTQPSARARSA
eukprot:7053260-Lingulodinium_polyedra.AAC.1